jgi:DNA-nicking Smr family endonuclease
VTTPSKRDHLADLAELRAAMLEQRRQAESLAAAERQRVVAERREQSLFAATVGAVVPLKKSATPALARARPPALARQRQRDEAAALAESISDAFDVESLLETDDALSFRRRGIGLDVVRKLRRGVWVLQDEIDLHGLRSDAARDRVAEFVRDSARAGLRCIRVVHGKGLGSPGREPVVKGKVYAWLVQRSEVLAFAHARPADGGHGALIVLLKPAPRHGTAD